MKLTDILMEQQARLTVEPTDSWTSEGNYDEYEPDIHYQAFDILENGKKVGELQYR